MGVGANAGIVAYPRGRGFTTRHQAAGAGSGSFTFQEQAIPTKVINTALAKAERTAERVWPEAGADRSAVKANQRSDHHGDGRRRRRIGPLPQTLKDFVGTRAALVMYGICRMAWRDAGRSHPRSGGRCDGDRHRIHSAACGRIGIFLGHCGGCMRLVHGGGACAKHRIPEGMDEPRRGDGRNMRHLE